MASLVFSVTSCHDGPRATIIKKVGNFDKITVNVPCDVYYTQGDTTNLTIEGPQGTLEKLTVNSDNGNLTIGNESGIDFWGMRDGSKLRVYASSTDIVAITLHGSGSFTVNGKIDSDTLSATLFGSGDMCLPYVICDKMSATLKGAGKISVGRLECYSSSIDLSGVGVVRVSQRNVGQTDANLRGMGSMEIDFHNCGNATCNILGVGHIKASGNVKHFERHVNGLGTINSGELNITK